MAVNGDDPKGYTKQGKKKASVNPFAAAPTRKQKRAVTGWDETSADLIAALVVHATEQGAAVMFGKTSDGGALTLAMYWQGEKEVTYITPNDDLDETLTDLAAFFEMQD